MDLASGVAGLIALSAAVVSQLHTFHNNLTSAPSTLAKIISEIESIQSIIYQIESLIEESSTEPLDENRLSMIQVKTVTDTITALIYTFSEMQKFIEDGEGLKKTRSGPPLMKRVVDEKGEYKGLVAIRTMGTTLPISVKLKAKIALRNEDYQMFLRDLGREKVTLMLIMSVLTRKDTSQAVADLAELKVKFNEMMETNSQIVSLLIRDGPPSSAVGPKPQSTLSMQNTIHSIAHSFQRVLKRTRVYRRDQVWDSSTLSATSSLKNRSHYTGFSELSLSEVSNIAVINLPIWTDDIWSAEYFQEGCAGETGKIQRGHVALLSAAADGDIDEVRALLDEGLNIECYDRNGFTPLHHTVFNGRIDTMMLLLDRGANPNSKTPHLQLSMLHSALRKSEQAEMVKILLEHGAEVDAKDILGNTALITAAEEGFDDVIEVLYKHGADVNAVGARRRRALHWAAEGGYLSTVKILLNAGAKTNVVNDVMRTPRGLAAKRGHTEIVRFLQGRHAVTVVS